MKRLEIPDLPEDVRELIRECELTGRKTSFDRDGRSVALLVSWDEYLALRETIEISTTPQLVAAMRKAEAEIEREAFVEDPNAERIRIPRSVQAKLDAQGATARTVLARIADHPIAGAPLFEPLRGLWSHREGTLRVIYRILPESGMVIVLAVDETPEIGRTPSR